MLDAIIPRLNTVTPDEGGAIYLKKIPNGQIAYRFKRGCDFDSPDHIAAADATVAVLLEVLKKMQVPGIHPYFSLLHVPSLADLSPRDGIGILIKKLPDGSFGIKIEHPCDFDHPEAVAPQSASLKFLFDWIRQVLGR